jgi:cob(I)alamin adenosyltransferase
LTEGVEKGLVEVFTGDGKGKTSAALGITLRAAGHGRRVYIVFFMKGNFPYGEQKILATLPGVKFACFGSEKFVNPADIKPEEKQEAGRALRAAREAVNSLEYDIVILDEVNVAVAWKLLDIAEVVDLIENKPERVDLILTGRGADPLIVGMADLVTNMVKVKHPYDRGIKARKGLDY